MPMWHSMKLIKLSERYAVNYPLFHLLRCIMTDGHLSCPSEKSESGVYYSYVYFFKLYVYSTFCFVLVFFCLFIKKGNVDVFSC